MLAKLIKYEIKATSRWFLPLYLSILIFAFLNKLLIINPLLNNGSIAAGNSFLSILRGIMSTLLMFVYVILLVGTFVATLIVVIQRFYKNLLGDEGYLMLTLPVNTWQHILSKLLVSMLWCILSVLVAICSILVIIPKENLPQLSDLLRQLKELFGTSGSIMLFIFMILAPIMTILEIYSAISLGHLFKKHRLLLSFGMYIAIDTITQFVWLLILSLVGYLTSRPFNASFDIAVQVKNMMGTIIVLCAVFSVGHFCLTSYLIKRKLNLE